MPIAHRPSPWRRPGTKRKAARPPTRASASTALTSMFLSRVPLYTKKMPSGNSSHTGAREPMPSDRPMNSQSASPARIRTRTNAPQGRASARPMTIARMTNALRIRTINELGFQPDSKTFWVVNSVGPGLELVLGPAAEPPNPRCIVGQRRLEVLDVEVGPEGLGDEHL